MFRTAPGEGFGNTENWWGLWAMAARNGDMRWGGVPGNRPKVGGSSGLADSLSFSSSASCRRFAFALLFWNQIFTCKWTYSLLILVSIMIAPGLTWVSVSLRELENSALSAMLRYCLSLNFFSNARSCCVVKGVLGFLLALCFLRAHRTIGAPTGLPPIDGRPAANKFHDR